MKLKVEQAVALMHPLAYSVRLNMRSAFLILRLHATLINFSPVVSLNYNRRVALGDTNESQT